MKLSLVFEADGIAVALFERHGLGWRKLQDTQLVWRESTDSETLAERLQALLRPLLLAWAVPPQTSVLVVPPAEIGGLIRTTQKDAKDDLALLCEKALATQLPYPIRELHYIWRQGSAAEVKDKASRRSKAVLPQTLAIYWLPKNWLSELRAALTRLGLRIDEVYNRAFLYGASASLRLGDWLLLEQRPGVVTGYLFDRTGLASASFCLEGDDSSLPLQLALALHALPEQLTLYGDELSDALRRVCDQRWPGQTVVPQHLAGNLAEQVFRRWHAGDTGIWFAPEPQRITSALTPWLVATSVVALSVVIGFSWYERKLSKEVAALDTSAERIRPAYKVASSRQRELFGMQTTLRNIEQFEKATPPLPAYISVSEHLPEGSWLVHYHASLKQTRLEGYGADAATVSKAFDDTPYRASSDKLTGQPVHAVDEKLQPFAVTLHDRPRLKSSVAKQPAQQPAQQSPAQAAKPGA